MTQEKYEVLHNYVMDFWNDIEDEFMKYDNIQYDDITNITYDICDYVQENFDVCNNMSNEEMYDFGISKVRNFLNQ